MVGDGQRRRPVVLGDHDDVRPEPDRAAQRLGDGHARAAGPRPGTVGPSRRRSRRDGHHVDTGREHVRQASPPDRGRRGRRRCPAGGPGSRSSPGSGGWPWRGRRRRAPRRDAVRAPTARRRDLAPRTAPASSVPAGPPPITSTDRLAVAAGGGGSASRAKRGLTPQAYTIPSTRRRWMHSFRPMHGRTPVLGTGAGLGDDVGIGHRGARHGDEVGVPGGEHGLGLGDVEHPPGVDDGAVGGRLDPARRAAPTGGPRTSRSGCSWDRPSCCRRRG